MKTLAWVLRIFGSILLVFSSKTYAESQTLHMLMHYNIVSLASNISDKECQDLLASPLYYTLSEGVAKYQDVAPDYKINHCQLVNKSFIDKGQYLFSEVYDVVFELQGKAYSHQEQVFYVAHSSVKCNFKK